MAISIVADVSREHILDRISISQALADKILTLLKDAGADSGIAMYALQDSMEVVLEGCGLPELRREYADFMNEIALKAMSGPVQ